MATPPMPPSPPPPPPPPRVPPPQGWVILDRVALVSEDSAEDAAAPRGATAALVAPPRVTNLTLPTRFHPNPAEFDRHPYVLAADQEAGILLNVGKSPFVGFDLAPPPPPPKPTSRLLLVRDFLPAEPGHRDAPTGSCVVTIPSAAPRELTNLKALGLISFPGSGGVDYLLAELRVNPGVNHAKLLSFRSGSAAWTEKSMTRLTWLGAQALVGAGARTVLLHTTGDFGGSISRGVCSALILSRILLNSASTTSRRLSPMTFGSGRLVILRKTAL